jgi:hypothetical protein
VVAAPHGPGGSGDDALPRRRLRARDHLMPATSHRNRC